MMTVKYDYWGGKPVRCAAILRSNAGGEESRTLGTGVLEVSTGEAQGFSAAGFTMGVSFVSATQLYGGALYNDI